MNGLFKDLYEKGVFVQNSSQGDYIIRRLNEMDHRTSYPTEALWRFPDTVKDMHARYEKAGADIITLFTSGLEERGYAAHQRVDLDAARKGIGGGIKLAIGLYMAALKTYDAYSAASLSPIRGGVKRMYRGRTFGEVDVNEAVENIKRRARALSTANPNVYLFETFQDLEEARICAETLKDEKLGPTVISFQPHESVNNLPFFHETLKDVRNALRELVDGIGFNCFHILPFGRSIDLVKEFREIDSEMPLFIYPHLGVGRPYSETLPYIVPWTRGVLKANEDAGSAPIVIGSCCGGSPEHTAAMRKEVGWRDRQIQPSLTSY